MLKKFIHSITEFLGFRLLRVSNFEGIMKSVVAGQRDRMKLDVILSWHAESIKLGLDLALKESRGQIGQDIAALVVNNFKKEGFFVEFGAGNGVDGSNTYILERHFGWHGILSEPARSWEGELKKNRSCSIDTRAVWGRTGDLIEFREADSLYESGIIEAANDVKGPIQETTRYSVETVSLQDLLEKNNAPSEIDYISIDTEGSEEVILKEFPFEKYTFNFISIEHNRSSTQIPIREILRRNGYRRIITPFGFEDWFIRDSLLNIAPNNLNFFLDD